MAYTGTGIYFKRTGLEDYFLGIDSTDRKFDFFTVSSIIVLLPWLSLERTWEHSVIMYTFFQEYFLLDSLTIRENISVPLTLQKLPHKKIEKMVRSLAERFGIASQLDKYPNELSGGQRQRASATRAL